MNKTKLKGNYLDKKEFLDLIIMYQKFGDKMKRKDLDTLGKMILSLVNHIAMKPNFSNYTYLEEMKSNAIITVWKGLNTFDINKTTNAFSYFTSTVINAFIFIINKEKTIQERKQEFMNNILELIEMKKEYRYPKKKFTQEFKEKNSNY